MNTITPSLFESVATDSAVELDTFSASLSDEAVQHPVSLVRRVTPAWKRLFDILGSLFLIILFSPLLLSIAIWIKLVSRGPVIFRQSRLGEMGEFFTIFKFRTMDHCDMDAATENHRVYVASRSREGLSVEKPDHSDRLIHGGQLLRSLSLDELPQLFNVLIGNMTLVGPRPDVLLWSDYLPWQLKRFEARPGITGLWQVSGKNRLTMDEMVQLDIEYIQKRNFWLDLWIMSKTFRVIFSKDNQ